MSRHAKHCVICWGRGSERYCAERYRHVTGRELAADGRRGSRRYSDRPDCPSGETNRARRELVRQMALHPVELPW